MDASSATTKPAAARGPRPRSLVLAVMMAHPELRDHPDGASLLAAHLIADKGEEETATMPTEALATYVRLFRASYPTAWPAARSGDATGFAVHLRSYGQARMTNVAYQARASELLLAHEQSTIVRARAS